MEPLGTLTHLTVCDRLVLGWGGDQKLNFRSILCEANTSHTLPLYQPSANRLLYLWSVFTITEKRFPDCFSVRPAVHSQLESGCTQECANKVGEEPSRRAAVWDPWMSKDKMAAAQGCCEGEEETSSTSGSDTNTAK